MFITIKNEIKMNLRRKKDRIVLDTISEFKHYYKTFT